MNKLISVFRITAFLTLTLYIVLNIWAEDILLANNQDVYYLLQISGLCFLISFILKIAPFIVKYFRDDFSNDD